MCGMQLIFLVLCLFFVSHGDEVWTIRADGAGNFLTLQACEDNRSGDFTGLGTVDCQFTQAGTYTGMTLISGQTNVSATNRLKVSSKLALGTVIIAYSGGSVVIECRTSFTWFDNLRMTSTLANHEILSFRTSPALSCLVTRCYFHSAPTTTVVGYGVTVRSGSNATVYSCVFDGNGQTGVGEGLYVYQVSQARVYNCIFMRYRKGIADEGSGPNMVTVRNTAFPVDDAYAGTFAGGKIQSYNWCKGATACTGTGSVNNVPVATFGLQADNFHITTRSAMYGAGTNLSSEGVLVDVDGQPWRRWSVGADDPTLRQCGILWKTGLGPCKAP